MQPGSHHTTNQRASFSLKSIWSTSISRNIGMVSILGRFPQLVKKKVKELFFISMGDHMKVTFLTILKKARDMSILLMVLSIREISNKGSKKVRASLSGRTEKFTTANGQTVKKMVAGCGKVQMGTHILVNGKMAKWKALAFWSWRKGIAMKVNLKIRWNLGWGQKDIPMEIPMWVNFQKIDRMGRENITVIMEIISKGYFQMDWSMAMEPLKVTKDKFSKDNIEMIKDVDLGSWRMLMEAFIVETLRTI